MKFNKIILDGNKTFYALLGMDINHESYLFYGSEGEGHLCVFYGDYFKKVCKIWEGGGGTMSIVPIKNKEGWILASRGFFSMSDSSKSTIEIVRYNNGQFTHKKIADLPYLHRFNILHAVDGTAYIVAATIASYKENIDDWSHPGHIYYAKLPNKLDSDFYVDMVRLKGDYYKNHGYFKSTKNGNETAYIGSQEGVFNIIPPQNIGEKWIIKKIFNHPTSDIAFIDIDGDGEEEMAAIMPFHGNQLKVFRKSGEEYNEIYSYPVENDFFHVIESANIRGEAVFIGGSRRLSSNLFILKWDNKKRRILDQEIDSKIGPSNAMVLNKESYDIILSANLETRQAAIYIADPFTIETD